MGDLISRQAAIDAVCSVCGDTECNIFDPNNTEKLHCPEPYAISKLPSAQPLQEEDLLELEHRFGEWVRFVVEDMISGKGERWLNE